MRDILPVDWDDRQHRQLMFNLALSNQRHLLNDYDHDLIMMLYQLEQHCRAGNIHGFLTLVDGQPAGAFWVEIGRYETGRIRGALFPEYRNTWNALYFLKWVVRYSFEDLELRKLDVEMTAYKKQDKEAAAAERIYKRIGFKFRAMLPQSVVVQGVPTATILLDYLRDDYHGFNI